MPVGQIVGRMKDVARSVMSSAVMVDEYVDATQHVSTHSATRELARS